MLEPGDAWLLEGAILRQALEERKPFSVLNPPNDCHDPLMKALKISGLTLALRLLSPHSLCWRIRHR